MSTHSIADRPTPSAAMYTLVLFVAGDEANSRLARRNLAELCEQDLRGRCEVEIVDVLEDYTKAVAHDVVLTPTLLSLRPESKARIIGNLNDREKVRLALRLE